MKKFIPTEKELKNILKMYNEDLLGSHTISEKTGISKPTVLRILKENGVVMGPSGRRFIGGKKTADKKWRDKNIDRHREYKRNYEKTRKHNDPTYKLIANFRTAIYTVLKENNMDKYGHYFDILRYSPEELVVHLENQFTEGMEWDNYGEWHVDHRLPITSFKFKEVGDNEFMRCWELNNLQPMWGDENISKSNKIMD